MNSVPVIVYIDGGARGNPGPAGYGVRVESNDGSVIEELTGYIGIATNNVAEYRGLVAALTYLELHGYRNVIIRSDSQLLTKQMVGQFKVRHPNLKPLHRQASLVASRLKKVRFEHVPRAENTEADRLANAAMDKTRTTHPSIENESDVPGNVLAIGVDIESIARIDTLLKRYGQRFLSRVFTDEEVSYSMRRRFPAEHFAGRFAAKEAAMKALGTGRSRGVLWRNVEVVRVTVPPHLQLHGEAARLFDAMGGKKSLITITHSGDSALAQVLFLSH